MKTKTTLLLLFVVIALALYIKFFESKGPNTAEAMQKSQNVVNFIPEDVEKIMIQNGDDRIELQRWEKKWRIENPFKDRANGGMVENLLTDLEGWKKWDTIPAEEIAKNKSRLDEFGLSNPKLRLKLIGKEMPPEILFGGDAAFEGRIYLRLEGSDDVYVAGDSIRTSISKKPEEFRDKKLTELTALQVTRVLLKTAAGDMELQKTRGHWDIVKPLNARADDQKVEDLVSQVTTAQIQQFVADDHADLHQYGLADPRGSITLFSGDESTASPSSSPSDQGQVLQIGAVSEKEKEQVYVRFTTRHMVYTLPKKIEDILATKPADLRDRHLIRFEADILDRLTVNSPDHGKTVLTRKEQSWFITSKNNKPANRYEVDRLVEMLKTEQVTRFVEDIASDLPKYGLDKPQIELTLSSFSSENTAETNAGEHPFATLAFGKVDGEDVYARVGDEPFIVAVRRAFLDNIFTDPLRWQDLVIFRFKPEEINRLTIVTDHESALARSEGKEWAWTKGEGPINQTNVQSILNTLAVLHAARWAGTTTPAHGFDKPQLTLTFATGSDDKKLHKLVVGGPAEGDMWYARTDDFEGTFVMSNPDYNTLRLPLVTAPPPSPTATP